MKEEESSNNQDDLSSAISLEENTLLPKLKNSSEGSNTIQDTLN